MLAALAYRHREAALAAVAIQKLGRSLPLLDCFGAKAPRNDGERIISRQSERGGANARASASCFPRGDRKAPRDARIGVSLDQRASAARRLRVCASACVARPACAPPRIGGLCSALCFAYRLCASVLSRLDVSGIAPCASRSAALSAVLSALQNALRRNGPFGCAIGCVGARRFEYKCASRQERPREDLRNFLPQRRNEWRRQFLRHRQRQFRPGKYC